MKKTFLTSTSKALWPLLGQLAMLCALSGPAPAQTSTDKTAEVQKLTETAQVAQQEGRYDDALRAYQTIAVIAADSPKISAQAHFGAGRVYMAVRKFDQAAAAFQRSISLNPESADSYNALGESLGELKRFTQAIEAFQQAVAHDANLLAARSNMGVTYDKMGQPKYAEFVYRMLVRDHPEYAEGYDGLAVMLSKSGRAREAIPLYEKAISLQPEEPSFYYNCGLNYLLLGDAVKAQEQQRKLRELNSPMADRLADLIAKLPK